MTTIPTITALPTPVPQTSDPTNFDPRADEFLAALPTMVTEENASITAMNTVAGEVSTNATSAAASAATATTGAGTATTEAGIATTQAGNASTSAAAALVSQNAAATSAGALSSNANSYRTVDLIDTTGAAVATAYAAGQTIDGTVIVAGWRIGRFTPGGAVADGIYDAPASGFTASRSADSNSAVLMPSGIEIRATRGTNYKGASFIHTTAPGYTLNTTSLVFEPALAEAPVIETTIASAATVDIGASNTENVVISGTTSITSFGTRAKRRRYCRVTGAMIITYNATSLITPKARNIQCGVGDHFIAESDGSGNWTIISYTRAANTLRSSGSASCGSDGVAVASLALTPGTWRLSSGVVFNGGASVPYGRMSISTTANTGTGTQLGFDQFNFAIYTTAGIGCGTIPCVEVTVAANTNYYSNVVSGGVTDTFYSNITAEPVI